MTTTTEMAAADELDEMDDMNFFNTILNDPALNSSLDSDKHGKPADEDKEIALPFKDSVKYDIFKKQNKYLDDRMKNRKYGSTRASFLAEKPMVFLRDGPVEPQTGALDSSRSARNATKSAGSKSSQLTNSPRIKDAEPTKYRRNPNIEDFLKDVRGNRPHSQKLRHLGDGLDADGRGASGQVNVINIIPATPLPTETATPKNEPANVQFDKSARDKSASQPPKPFRSVTENFHQKLNEKLKLTLMNEFDSFLDEKASKAVTEIKNQNRWYDSDSDEPEPELTGANKAFLTELNDPNATQSFVETTTRSLNDKEKKVAKPGQSPRKSPENEFEKFYKKEEADKKSKLKSTSTEALAKPANPNTKLELVPVDEANANKISNMQVALLTNEDNSMSASSLIQLNKMLESIKRIDLPKFQTELHQICQYGGDGQLLKFYPDDIEYDLNQKQNGMGRYCIHECCVKGNVNMLKSLLPHIDNINKQDEMNGYSAAHICAVYGELECLKLLCIQGIDLKLRDKTGCLPQHLAAKHNYPKIIEFLYEYGCSFNRKCDRGKIPLHYAAEYGSLGALKAMTSYYIDFTMLDNDGMSPAHLACVNNRLDSLKYLVSVGFPMDKVLNTNNGRNLTHTCCLFGSTDCLHWLLENKANLRALDDNGNSLAHLSCLGGNAECLNCCIQHDDDIDLYAKNKMDETPIDLARKVGKSLHIERAIKNELACKECVKKAKQYKYDREHEKTVGEKTMERNKHKIYHLTSSIVHGPSAASVPSPRPLVVKDDQEVTLAKGKGRITFQVPLDSKSSSANTALSKLVIQPASKSRDLIAQFFGPEI